MEKIWKFRTDKDYSVNLYQYYHKFSDYTFYDTIDGAKQVVGYIKDGVLTILKGYEWDGCTPKFKLFGKLFGVLDFDRTKEASLVHDFLIEYKAQHSIGRKIIDIIFESILKVNKFKLRWVYASAVHAYRVVANLD